jgi:MYXO-CTERM domain-containing protein
VTRRRLVALVAAVAALAATASALGYVRSRTSKSGKALAWQGSSCAYITPDSAGTPDLSLADVTAAIDASAQTWSEVPCSYFRLNVDAPEPHGSAVLDKPQGLNYVVFRTDKWCPPDASEPCYDPNATALTTVFYIDRPGEADDGRILDADVEVNNLDFAFTVDGTPPPDTHGRPVADVQNTLTHEFGHLLGLDHTCYDGWNPCENGKCKTNQVTCTTELDCYPVDDTGAKIPNCNDALPPKVTGATMYNYASAGDTSKRTLSQDDVDGVCNIYPTASDPGVCSRVDTGGDSGCAAGGRPAAPALLLLALGALLLRRRRG